MVCQSFSARTSRPWSRADKSKRNIVIRTRLARNRRTLRAWTWFRNPPELAEHSRANLLVKFSARSNVRVVFAVLGRALRVGNPGGFIRIVLDNRQAEDFERGLREMDSRVRVRFHRTRSRCGAQRDVDFEN